MAELVAGAWSLKHGSTPLAATATLAGDELRILPSVSLPSSSTVELVLNTTLTDRASNALAAARTMTFDTSDTGVPAPQVDAVPPYVCGNNRTLTGTAALNVLVQVTGGAGDVSTRPVAVESPSSVGPWSVDVSLLSERLHRLSVTAVDGGGKVSAPVFIDVVNDCEAPLVSLAERTANNFSITFSEPIDSTSTSSAITVSDAGGAVAGSVSTTGAVSIWTATSALPVDATLSLDVNVAVTDLAGNALAYAFEWC